MPPEIVVLGTVNQVGTWDPANGQYAAGWTTLVIRNGGTSAYTQLTLSLTPRDASLVPIAALDGTQAVPTASSLCSIVGNTFECAWNNSLGGGEDTAPIRFVFGGAVVPSEVTVDAHVTSKDLTNTGDSNQVRDDDYPALFTISTSDQSEDRTNFTPPNTAISLSTWRGNSQKSAISLPASTSGYLVELYEQDPGIYTCTESGFTGTSNEVWLNVNDGAPVKVLWTLTLIKVANSGPVTSVLHCLDDGTVQVISNACANKADTNCIESIKVTLSGKNKSTATYVIKVRTPSNGKMRA
jgi:hypothetical protein